MAGFFLDFNTDFFLLCLVCHFLKNLPQQVTSAGAPSRCNDPQCFPMIIRYISNAPGVNFILLPHCKTV